MNDERDKTKWINEYQTLKQVNPVNPFVVPANYFNEMEGQVMDQIRLCEFKQAHPGDGFVLPENYFDELTQNIQSRAVIDAVLDQEQSFTIPENYFDELSQNIQSRIAVEGGLNAGHDFAVPENYFDELSQNIQSRVAIEEILNTQQGFAVPENYFDELSQSIQSRVAIEEILNTEQGFTVPENYFAGLESRIMQSTVNEGSVKTNNTVVRKLWNTAAFKYATAACFSLFVGGAVLMTEFNDQAIHNRSDLHKALSKVSASDMEMYLELNGDTPSILEDADPNTLTTLSPDNSGQDKIN